MTKLYSGDITITATAYVIATNEEEARQKIEALRNTGIEFSSRRQEIGDNLCITGESYSADMPEVSLSPAMTINDSPSRACVWLAEELGEEEGEAA